MSSFLPVRRRPADHSDEPGQSVAFILEIMRQISVKGDAVAPLQAPGSHPTNRWRVRLRARRRTVAAPGSHAAWGCPPCPLWWLRARAAPYTRVASPGSGGVSSSMRWPPRLWLRGVSRGGTHDHVGRFVEAEQLESSGSRPEAMREATAKAGLVPPRSTCEEHGGRNPQRLARSRSDRPMACARRLDAHADRVAVPLGDRAGTACAESSDVLQVAQSAQLYADHVHPVLGRKIWRKRFTLTTRRPLRWPHG